MSPLCYRDNVTRGLLNVTVLLSSSIAVTETWTKPLVRPAPRLIHGAPHASAWARTRLLPGPQKLNDEANVEIGGDEEVVTRIPAVSNESNCHWVTTRLEAPADTV